MKVLNDILGYKGLKLFQDPDCFCFSLDSVVLANYCNIRVRDSKIVEFCSGNGVVSIIMSQRTKANIIGIEIQEKLYNMANESLNINNLNERITFINEDIKEYVKGKDNNVDLIVCNPPYFKYDQNNKINDSIEKQIARHEICITLEQVIETASKIINHSGSLYLVHRCDRFVEILDLFKKYRFGLRKLQFVYDNYNSNSCFLLIEAKYECKDDLKVLKPLYIDKYLEEK